MLILLLLALASAGCVQLAEVDATTVQRYAPVLGRTFELKEEFVARAVQRPRQKSPDFDHIVVMPPPGIGGHLVQDRGRIPAGSRFRIVGVVSRRSQLFPKDEYVISFNDPAVLKSEGKDVRIYHVAAWKLYLEPSAIDGPPSLSENYFRPVPAARSE